MSEVFDAIVSREKQVFMPTVRRWPVALERGLGSRVWDVEGREYVDLTAGWGVTAIGHCHPELVEAISDQARTLMQTTNIVYTKPQLDLAERLARIAPRGHPPVVLHVERRRGQRGRAQARRAQDRSQPLRGHAEQLPRPHARRDGVPRSGEVPRAVEGHRARGDASCRTATRTR